MERSGGAIGDVNGDEIFDTIDITTFITKITSYDLSKFIAHSVLTRFSLDLNRIDKQIIANYEADIFNKTIDQNVFKDTSKFIINNKSFSIIRKQTWNEYLGRYGNSHYYRKLNE
jgi:TPP-dependent indolepyruvate ferredoxin oxidoreductase alpha subunit